MSELGLDGSTCIALYPHNGPREGVDILQLCYKIILKLDMIKNNIQVKVCKLIMNRVFKKDFFLMWTIFEVFMEFVLILLLFHVLFFFLARRHVGS